MKFNYGGNLNKYADRGICNRFATVWIPILIAFHRMEGRQAEGCDLRVSEFVVGETLMMMQQQ